jgi:integrin beta 1
MKETPVCNNVGINQTVEFEVEIRVDHCPSKKRHDVKIKPVGLNDVMRIKLNTMCECECEKEESEEIASPK